MGGGESIPVIFALVAVESLLSTMIRPLQTSALPFLARTPGELTAANLSLTTIESAGMLLGPALSAVLLAVWSPAGVLAVTTVAYVLSTATISSTPSTARRRAATPPTSWSTRASARCEPASPPSERH